MKKLGFAAGQILCLLSLFVVASFCSTTVLDTAFNGTGYNFQTIGTGSALGESLVVQPDDKIIVSGSAYIAADDRRITLMRLNADGSLDTSFGTNGTIFSPLGHIGWKTTVLLQPDGKILVGGVTYLTQQQIHAYAVLRFTSSGALDTTFNNTGYATATVPNSFWDLCQTMALQPDGKIVLSGQSLTTPGQDPDWDISIVRFNSNGSLDTTFDGDGILKIGTTDADENANSLLVQSNGKIIVGGVATTDVQKYLLTRFNADGTLDTTFATNGWNIFQFDFTNNNFTSLAQQSDGKFLGSGGGKIFRFSADGVRDMSFATNGVQTATGTIEPAEIHVLANDKFLISTRDGIRRYMANGAVDTNYGYFFHLPGTFSYMRSVAVQSDGKAVLGGYFSNNSNNIYQFAVVRFKENRTKRFLDFNGDEQSEISLFRPSSGQWLYIDISFTGTNVAQFGVSTDRPIPADYTGDGKTDIAVFRPSTSEWFVLRSDNGTYFSFRFGTAGDMPVADDFDGDQIADAGVFRPSTNQWFIQKSSGGYIYATFGSSGDKLVPSDYDGDYKADIAIYRPSTGEWWVNKSSDGNTYAFRFGASEDKPVQGDYTGDGKTDAAFWRPSTGEWFILRSEDFSYYSIPFGLSDDLPTPGNYTGDSRFDLVVYRPSTNTWHIQPTGGAYFYRIFGAAGDQPVPNIFVP